MFSTLAAQSVDSRLYQNLKWRCIGPFRGGRTVGAVGIPNQPNVFFIGVNHGGVWKTDDAGRTWKPIFDDQPTGSIGDVAVSPANPNTIYVGSGEGLQRPDLSVGDGLYKSTDGGKTWRNMGLRDGQQIGGIAVDPKDENRLFVAVLGHPYGANEERGVYRSLDGGETWKRVLYKDVNTGAVQVTLDPNNSKTVYADLWAGRQGPWENGQWNGPESGLFKSTDGGDTWKKLTEGLPTVEKGLSRIGFTIAPADSSRLYATVQANQGGGIYRSDDGGEHWRLMNSDPRLWGRGDDFAEVKVHPRNPEVVFVANTCSYKSTDGGKTFAAFKGAPGGDDYHRIWINPEQPDIMLFATDQGATITVNGGRTWSSWYNQPTAQFYHVMTDNQFPYWVYGGQQESGSAGVASRGDYGAITWRDWQTVGVEEYGYVAPDPLNPNLIYGGKLTRFDRSTGQVQDISPEAVRSGKYRFLRTAPVLFSPVNPKLLFYAGNVLFKTLNGGHSWDIISPDLSREKTEVPESIGVYRTPAMETMPRRGVIYTVAPSSRDVNLIWAGTDDGLIHVTRDGGKNWRNVTPPELTSWSKVSLLDASHFDSETAYAAINRFRLDDVRPHIYRTHDGGKSWQEITKGIPSNEVVNAVREDPERRGLLYAGTERAVYFSIDDGDNWQTLRLNMPSTAIRDVVVHGDDIVVGTHGRSFWILDDITPLRQITKETALAEAVFFKPQTAIRIRRSLNTDTPIPPEEPMGQNPPDGAIFNYCLQADAKQPVTLDIVDAENRLVRRFSSEDRPEPITEAEHPYPGYWFRLHQPLSAKAGMQRFVWDLLYPAPPGLPRALPISAIYRDTPTEPLGPAVMPGTYQAILTVNGKTYAQPLVVKLDPRVKTPLADLKNQFIHSKNVYDDLVTLDKALIEIRQMRSRIAKLKEEGKAGEKLEALNKLDEKLAAFERTTPRGPANAPQPVTEIKNLALIQSGLNRLLDILQGADMPPTTQVLAAEEAFRRDLERGLRQWKECKETEAKGY
ncbi:MAG: glycoside hydrolase [Blastocatellia bacterium]|nr:glycoside hydrolase [Blastocatellia bacterium]